MSRTIKAADDDAPQRSPRPFDAVVITLSAALLVIFGIVIGRFAVSTPAVEVVDHFDAELSALRAELVDLHRQNLQNQARSEELAAAVEHFRAQAQQQQIRAESLAARQMTVRTRLSDLNTHRERCLNQVQQYVALNQPIPALDVLRFAQDMFQLEDRALGQLSSIQTTSATLATVPGFPPVAATTPATNTTAELASSQPTTCSPGNLQALPAPAAPSSARSGTQTTGAVYFAPPKQKSPPGSDTFFAARRSSPDERLPRRSGITFHDTASVEDGTARR